MQTDEKNLNTIFKKILTVLIVSILFCAFCAAICNISAIKNAKIENTFEDYSVKNQENGKKPQYELCTGNERNYVHIGGNPIGIAISADGLIVVDKCAVSTKNGEVFPSARADIRKGDVILSVNGIQTKSVYKLKNILKEANSPSFLLKVKRGNSAIDVKVNAVRDNLGQYKLGLALKEDVGGVGTMTFVTDNGQFAALGHHITDGESGLVGELNRGNIYNTSVSGVVKGEKGKAGGLVADVNRLSKSVGDIKENTNIGLYGVYSGDIKGDLYRVAAKGEAKIGKAQVLTTIDGSTPKFYDIEIVKVISQSEVGEKGMVILVRDKELLEKTGGIVQGMSGSPIVQNGILIGAVTHVFIQDPTRGYAVHSRFMYDYASDVKANIDAVNDQIAA